MLNFDAATEAAICNRWAVASTKAISVLAVPAGHWGIGAGGPFASSALLAMFTTQPLRLNERRGGRVIRLTCAGRGLDTESRDAPGLGT